MKKVYATQSPKWWRENRDRLKKEIQRLSYELKTDIYDYLPEEVITGLRYNGTRSQTKKFPKEKLV